MPRSVYLSELDNRLLLDLDDPDHADILRYELLSGSRSRSRVVYLQEALPSKEDSWLKGPGGGHLAELVVPLIKEQQNEDPAFLALPEHFAFHSREDQPRALEPPGGKWLYLKLYCSDQAEDNILSEAVSKLVRRIAIEYVDIKFFFVRYADPDRHLRLRWTGAQNLLWGAMFPQICAWAQSLLQERLCTRISFDTYDPEIERYGGKAGLRLAEEIACIDSSTVLGLLEGCETEEGYPRHKPIIASATIEALLSNLRVPVMNRRALITGRSPRHPDIGRQYRRYLTDLEPVRKYISSHETDGLPSWMTTLNRYEQLRPLGLQLQELANSRKLSVRLEDFYASVLHMHCNRFLGLNRELENEAILLWGRTSQAALARSGKLA